MVFEESSNSVIFHYQSRDFYYASYVERDFQFMANYTVATAIIIVVQESIYNCNSLISPAMRSRPRIVAAIYSYTYFRVFLKVKYGHLLSNCCRLSIAFCGIASNHTRAKQKLLKITHKCCIYAGLVCVWLAHQIFCSRLSVHEYQ